ncbi:MAG: DUF5615 family PIN-like protein [Balneolaceae bacterium]
MAKLYLDEDVHGLLVALLRARNISVETTQESNMLGHSDEAQLEYAIKSKAVLVTHNRVDFENLYIHYMEKNINHYGIIILIRRNVHLMARRLSAFLQTHDELINKLWYV